MSVIDRLMEKAVSPQRLRTTGRYTVPRSFGVYRLTGNGNVGKRHRIGNHPVRERELVRDFRECEVVALFLSRNDAESLARHLNS